MYEKVREAATPTPVRLNHKPRGFNSSLYLRGLGRALTQTLVPGEVDENDCFPPRQLVSPQFRLFEEALSASFVPPKDSQEAESNAEFIIIPEEPNTILPWTTGRDT